MRLKQINAYLKAKLLQYLPEQASIETAIDGLRITRHNQSYHKENCFYQPIIGIVVQGDKHSIIGNEEYSYGENYCITTGIDMPSINHFIVASSNKPFLGVSIKLDRYLISQLMIEFPELAISINSKASETEIKSVIVTKASYEILNAFLRLIELLDYPERINALSPMIIREIHYLLLAGPQGDCLRMISALGTQTNRIARAICYLRENYKNQLDVKKLAQQVNMVPSSFYRHFKHITTLSPLQFQKKLRLFEAERLMIMEGYDTLSAAFEVGYESATQFNREYKRQFGAPPHQDINKKRLIGFNVNNDIVYPVI